MAIVIEFKLTPDIIEDCLEEALEKAAVNPGSSQDLF